MFYSSENIRNFENEMGKFRVFLVGFKSTSKILLKHFLMNDRPGCLSADKFKINNYRNKILNIFFTVDLMVWNL